MILLLLIIIFIIIIIKNYEHYNELNESKYIDYYVIHIDNLSNKKRKDNIKINEIKLGKKINIFNAINGKNIDKNKLDKYDKNIKLNCNFKKNGELGCYLSHFILIKNAIKSNKKYTVIFEDDFKILSNNLNKEIVDITKKVNNNFDLIYLGNLFESKSHKIVDNIYKKNKFIPIIGTHALLINNKNAKKIYNNLLNINDPIDIKLDKLINKNKLNYYIIYPSIVIQNNDFESSLRSSYYIRNILQKLSNLLNKIYNIY